MKRSVYLQPTAIFWDRNVPRAVDEAEQAIWRGLPLAGGRLSFAAVDILMRAPGGSKRKTVVLGDAFSGDWGRDALAASDILKNLTASPTAASLPPRRPRSNMGCGSSKKARTSSTSAAKARGRVRMLWRLTKNCAESFPSSKGSGPNRKR
jgi:hypothetical protein